MTATVEIALNEIAHGRSGDKGNRLNISLICYTPLFYETVAEQMTADRVRDIFRDRNPSRVVRYELPRLAAFNFVLDDVLEGGINASLGLDGHGKTLSFLLLSQQIRIAPELLPRIVSASARSPAHATATGKGGALCG
jgi:hypothetical protein